VTTARRSRTIAATPETVWEVVSDPHHLPRWWPGVKRMEGVGPEVWTEVHLTKKGRAVRVDSRLLESEPLLNGSARRAWEQEIAGTPFEHVLDEAITEVALKAAGPGTEVTIERRQRLRGSGRLGGGFMLKRATLKRLDEALDELERILKPAG
jgi:carbon monoxide dehydrogenase subunit G